MADALTPLERLNEAHAKEVEIQDKLLTCHNEADRKKLTLELSLWRGKYSQAQEEYAKQVAEGKVKHDPW